MPGGQLTLVLKQLRRIVATEPPDRSDADLLGRFLQTNDPAVFASLVERHGRLVWNVCRRILDHDQDAEDAFQATFLLLAQQARSIRKHESLNSWLYGVAYRVAARARSRRKVQRERTMSLASDPVSPSTAPETGWDDLKPFLDEEVDRLPSKYRVAVLLCYFGGKTHAEAGRALGWPTGTVAGRLARARDLLRRRLLRRGLTLSSAALGALLVANAASASVPELLSLTTTQMAVAASSTGLTTGIAANVTALSQGVAKAMMIKKAILASCVCIAALLVMTGGSMGTYWALTQEGGKEGAGPALEPAAAPPAKAKTDEELLQGVWKLDQREGAKGKELESEVMIVRGEQFWWSLSGTTMGPFQLRLDPAKSPKEMDQVLKFTKRADGVPVPQDHTRKAIYEINPDTLRISLSRDMSKRPADWKGELVFAYHRVVEADFHVIPLKHTNATEIADILGKLFKDAAGSPKVIAEARTNSLIITVTAKQLDDIKIIIEKLDTLGAKPEVKPGGRVRELAQERLKVAKEGYDVQLAARRAGRASVGEILPWSKRLLEAELDVATTRQERVDAMQRYFEHLKEVEDQARKSHRAGAITSSEMLEAAYQRIDFELKMEQEKGK